MGFEIREDEGNIIIEGYVNAIERDSRPIPSIHGEFIEQVKENVFKRAIQRADDIALLLNHDEKRKLGSTNEGNLKLSEDNIGLRAIATISDKDVIKKAKNNELSGWSFGFYVNKDSWENSGNGYQRRYIEDMELFEISILDNTKTPAYKATSIEVRNGKEFLIEERNSNSSFFEEENHSKTVNYSLHEAIIKVLKNK